jgi:hypothetical protein
MATNGDELDMELENVSRAQVSSSLRYSISESSPIGNQHHLEVALAIINVEGLISSVKRRKHDGEMRTTSINTDQGEDTALFIWGILHKFVFVDC